MKNNNNKGQALVLVLLSLSVILTIVLFILSRSITDIAISTSDEESVRAFSAAEAGIEKALVLGPSSGNIGDARYNATFAPLGEGEYGFNYLSDLLPGESATLWFTSHDTNGNVICDATHPCFSGVSMDVCWGTPDPDFWQHEDVAPAVEVSVFYNNGTVKIARDAFDTNDPRRNQNGFNQPDASGQICTIDGKSYLFFAKINFADFGISPMADGVLKFARIRMFYNSDKAQPIGFNVNYPGNDPLPAQGVNISSVGTSGSSTRRVEVYHSYPEAPTIFDNVLFSSEGITK